MEKKNIWEIEGTEYPAGRRTRVMIGLNGAITGDKICQGYVVVYKGGGIPEHEHENIESYTILKGSGEMTVSEGGINAADLDQIRIVGGCRHIGESGAAVHHPAVHCQRGNAAGAVGDQRLRLGGLYRQRQRCSQRKVYAR